MRLLRLVNLLNNLPLVVHQSHMHHRLAQGHVSENPVIVGIDEAGRGPLAGPVVAAAVVLPELEAPPAWLLDSKALRETQRLDMYHWICEHALFVGVGMSSASVIDSINILQATMRAMVHTLRLFPQKDTPHTILIDGNRVPKEWAGKATAIVKGDQKIRAISAASIIAKVTRDHIMHKLDQKFPMYGFKNHKGYGTKKHLETLQTYGPLKGCHRMTFGPVAKTTEHHDLPSR